MKWVRTDYNSWESIDGQWRIVAEGARDERGLYVTVWGIRRLVDGRWKRIKGRHTTLASAKVAVAMFVEDAAR